MAKFFCICLGGAVGTGLRYLCSEWLARALGTGFPFATLLVNLVGSFLLALLMVVGIETTVLSPTLRLALTTGVMGGLTTYSTFSYETLQYLQDGRWGAGIGYLAATVVGGLAACLLGWYCGRCCVGS